MDGKPDPIDETARTVIANYDLSYAKDITTAAAEFPCDSC